MGEFAPYYNSAAAPSGASVGAGSANSAGATAQNAGPQGGAGSAVSQDSGRVIPIQFYYTIPMRPLDSDTRNRFCRSNIVALSDRVDQDSQASRQQAMAIAGRYRASFLEKCNRLGTTYDVGNLQLTIHGMNTRETEPFVNPSHPSDYRVTLP